MCKRKNEIHSHPLCVSDPSILVTKEKLHLFAFFIIKSRIFKLLGSRRNWDLRSCWWRTIVLPISELKDLWTPGRPIVYNTCIRCSTLMKTAKLECFNFEMCPSNTIDSWALQLLRWEFARPGKEKEKLNFNYLNYFADPKIVPWRISLKILSQAESRSKECQVQRKSA